MKKINKLAVRLFNDVVDEWADNYSHAEFTEDGSGFKVYKADDQNQMTAWYNTDYVTSIIINEVECED